MVTQCNLSVYNVIGDVIFSCYSSIRLCVGNSFCTSFGTKSTLFSARRYASAGNSDRNVSVRLSVCPMSICPSDTRRYCAKTNKASVVFSSPSGSSKTLVFWRQISSPNSKGSPPPNGGLKQGSVGKIQRFFRFKRQYLENGSRYGQSYY